MPSPDISMFSHDENRPQIPQYAKAEGQQQPTKEEIKAKWYIDGYEGAGLRPSETEQMEWHDLENIHPEQKVLLEVTQSLIARHEKAETFSVYDLLVELRKAGLLRDTNTVVLNKQEMKLFRDSQQSTQGFFESWKEIKNKVSDNQNNHSFFGRSEFSPGGGYGYDSVNKRPFIVVLDTAEPDESAEGKGAGTSKLSLEAMIDALVIIGHEIGHKIDDEKTGYQLTLLKDLKTHLESELRQMHFSYWFMRGLKKNLRENKDIEKLSQQENSTTRKLLMEHFKIKNKTSIFSKVRKAFNL